AAKPCRQRVEAGEEDPGDPNPVKQVEGGKMIGDELGPLRTRLDMIDGKSAEISRCAPHRDNPPALRFGREQSGGMATPIGQLEPWPGLANQWVDLIHLRGPEPHASELIC